MHGIIFTELRKYVSGKVGKEAWDGALKDAGLAAKIYLPIQSYPDTEAVAIITAVSRKTGQGISTILEDFGEFIAPHLLNMYRVLLKAEWRTLDVIENTEATIHRLVRLNTPDAAPPKLVTRRPTPNEVIITYTSKRGMCAVAKGIAGGIAKQYNERIRITETGCMLKGAPTCEISVKLEQ